MAEYADLLAQDLSTQAALLAQGQLSARELIDAQLTAIAAAQPALNAFIACDPERSLADAQASDAHRRSHGARALEGLPIAIKDNIDVAGWRTTAGMATRKQAAPAADDAPAVARLRAAGAVIVGKLNLNEAALGADNDNPHFGRCINPHRAGFTPGGSSGGSGAAVAAGLCAAALGSDSMGSVRIPASYCGVVGLKPTYGLISPRGSVVVSRRLDHLGPLTRSVRDLGVLLEVLAGFDPQCAQARALELAAAETGALRIGIADVGALRVEPAVAAAFAAAQPVFERLGHRWIALTPALPNVGPFRRAGLLLCEAEMLIEHADDWQRRRALFSPALAALLDYGAGKSAAELIAAERRLDDAALLVRDWFTQCDVIALPTTAQAAFAFGEPVPANQADLTCLANIAGVPALSLPLPVAAGELPIGLQLWGRRGAERSVLALAQSLANEFGAA